MNQSMQEEKQKKYAAYVKKVTPSHSLPLNMAKAFLTGGLICLLGQIITNFAKSKGLEPGNGWNLVFRYSGSDQRNPYRL